MSALTELADKSISEIEAETATVWAGRSLASFQLFFNSGDIGRLLDAEEFMHEALEHAALSEHFELLAELGPKLVEAARAAREHASQLVYQGMFGPVP